MNAILSTFAYFFYRSYVFETVNAMVLDLIPTRGDEIFNIDDYFCFGNESKRDVEFRFKDLGNGSVLMASMCFSTRFPGFFCLPCAGYSHFFIS